MKRIFVLNLRGNVIGDSIKESALFEYLKQEPCYLATTGGSVINQLHLNNPHINEFHELKELNHLTQNISKIKKAYYSFKAMWEAFKLMKGFDVCVLTQKHKYPYYLIPKLRGIKTILEKEKLPYKSFIPKMYFSDEEEKKTFFPKKNKQTICINIESKDPKRCWDRDNYVKLIDKLVNKYQIVLLGTDLTYNRPLINKFNKQIINLINRTTIRESASVIKQADLYIGNDSGLSHIAAAVKTDLINIMLDSTVDIFNDGTRVVKLRKPKVKDVVRKI